MLYDGTGTAIRGCGSDEVGGLQRGKGQAGRRGEVTMEQTLLPDGGSPAEINIKIDCKKPYYLLDFRSVQSDVYDSKY